MRAAIAVRAALGLTMLTRPERIAGVIGAPPGRHPVVRILGLRHLAQATALGARPGAAAVRASNLVDGLHVLSCLIFAVAVADRRSTALREGGMESGVLLATWAAGR